jgi:hypothetical protein
MKKVLILFIVLGVFGSCKNKEKNKKNLVKINTELKTKKNSSSIQKLNSSPKFRIVKKEKEIYSKPKISMKSGYIVFKNYFLDLVSMSIIRNDYLDSDYIEVAGNKVLKNSSPHLLLYNVKNIKTYQNISALFVRDDSEYNDFCSRGKDPIKKGYEYGMAFFNESINSIFLSSDGVYAGGVTAVGYTKGNSCNVWNLKTNEMLLSIKNVYGKCNKIKKHPTLPLIIIGCKYSAFIVNLNSKKVVKKYEELPLYLLKFSTNGKFLFLNEDLYNSQNIDPNKWVKINNFKIKGKKLLDVGFSEKYIVSAYKKWDPIKVKVKKKNDPPKVKTTGGNIFGKPDQQNQEEKNDVDDVDEKKVKHPDQFMPDEDNVDEEKVDKEKKIEVIQKKQNIDFIVSDYNKKQIRKFSYKTIYGIKVRFLKNFKYIYVSTNDGKLFIRDWKKNINVVEFLVDNNGEWVSVVNNKWVNYSINGEKYLLNKTKYVKNNKEIKKFMNGLGIKSIHGVKKVVNTKKQKLIIYDSFPNKIGSYILKYKKGFNVVKKGSWLFNENSRNLILSCKTEDKEEKLSYSFFTNVTSLTNLNNINYNTGDYYRTMALKPKSSLVLHGNESGRLRLATVKNLSKTKINFQGDFLSIYKHCGDFCHPDNKRITSHICREFGGKNIYIKPKKCKNRCGVAHRQYITSLGFSIDGKYAYSTGYSWDGGCFSNLVGRTSSIASEGRIWDVQKKKEICNAGSIVKGAPHVEGFTISPDGKLFAESFYEIKIHRTKDCKVIKTIPLYRFLKRNKHELLFTPNNQYLIGFKNKIDIFDVKTGEHIKEIPVNLGEFFNIKTQYHKKVMGVSYDSEYVSVGSSNHANISPIFKNSPRYIIKSTDKYNEEYSYVKFSKNGKYFYGGTVGGSFSIWDWKKGEEIIRIRFLKDGEWIILTKSGYFATSKGALKMINLYDKTNKKIDFKKVKKFNKPNRIKQIIRSLKFN